MFESRRMEKKKSAMRNLFAMMLQDGKIHDNEIQFFRTAGIQSGLSESELREIADDPGSVEFIRPRTEEEKTKQISDLVLMMMVDGRIDEREMTFCQRIAVLFGFPASIVQFLVDHISETGLDKHLEGQLGDIFRSQERDDHSADETKGPGIG